MALITFGLNHKVAPLSVREKFALSAESEHSVLSQLLRQDAVNEAVVLSTCNRTEVFYQGEALSQSINPVVKHYLSDLCKLPYEQMCPYLYLHQDRAALKHILRVAVGLDSMVMGEPQILGQVKAAYQTAEQVGSVGKYLRQVFQYVFSVSKQIRSQTDIGRNPISVAFVAVHIARKIFASLQQTNVLLLGSGQTTALVSRYLHDFQVANITFAGRDAARTARLAAHVNGRSVALTALDDVLPQADIIISATASAQPIVMRAQIAKALQQRRYKPLLLIDIAMPRDIESDVAKLDNVYLYNLDDLQQVIEQGLLQRQYAAKQADALIDAHVEYFMRRLRALDSVATIKAYRGKAEAVKEACLQKAQQQLRIGVRPDEVLQQFANSITNKLLHEPCVQMREASEYGHLEMLQYAKILFDLDP